ncbi:MAG: hypothetical protein GX044_05940 [Firmicutes bacterium]|nr:hypothetical protein [Bacillota bacterium]
MLRKFITAILIILLLLFVSAPLATLIRKKPTIAVTIRSWSMPPLSPGATWFFSGRPEKKALFQ